MASRKYIRKWDKYNLDGCGRTSKRTRKEIKDNLKIEADIKAKDELWCINIYEDHFDDTDREANCTCDN